MNFPQSQYDEYMFSNVCNNYDSGESVKSQLTTRSSSQQTQKGAGRNKEKLETYCGVFEIVESKVLIGCCKEILVACVGDK